MSHTINITRRITTTTTVTSGSAMGLNLDYLKTVPGLLLLAETLVGAVVIGLCCGSAAKTNYICLNNRELFLLVIAVTLVITTFLMLVSNVCHQPTSELLPKTLFVLLYHCFGFLLYLAGAITVMVAVNVEGYRGARYTELLVASIFAVINTILYFISVIFSYKAFKK